METVGSESFGVFWEDDETALKVIESRYSIKAWLVQTRFAIPRWLVRTWGDWTERSSIDDCFGGRFQGLPSDRMRPRTLVPITTHPVICRMAAG